MPKPFLFKTALGTTMKNLSWEALCWRDSAAKPPEEYAGRSCSQNADCQVPWKHPILSYITCLKKHTETRKRYPLPLQGVSPSPSTETA